MSLFETDEKTATYLKEVGDLTKSLQTDFIQKQRKGPVPIDYRDPRFEEIVKLTSRRMKIKIMQYKKGTHKIDEFTAADIVADIYVEFFAKRIMTIKDTTRTVGYLYTILRTKCLEEVKKTKEVSLETIIIQNEPVAPNTMKERSGQRSEDVIDDCLSQALNDFAKDNEQSVELLRQNTGMFEGKTEEPVALELLAEEEGITYVNMRKKISNIRKKLTTYFTKDCMEVIQENYMGR